MPMASNEILAKSPSPSVSSEQYSISGMVPNDPSTRPQFLFSDEEAEGALERSASTGKFWDDWDNLKTLISYHLKQVLLQYPEAKMTSEQQTSSLGETFPDLVKRLDDALNSFDEGPPFTLQRLCEILLSAKSIYPQLPKLAFALEKNLLVTSTLTVATDSQALVTDQDSNGSYERGSPIAPHTSSVENGVMTSVGDGDEIMAEVHEPEVSQDLQTADNIVIATEGNPTPMAES